MVWARSSVLVAGPLSTRPCDGSLICGRACPMTFPSSEVSSAQRDSLQPSPLYDSIDERRRGGVAGVAYDCTEGGRRSRHRRIVWCAFASCKSAPKEVPADSSATLCVQLLRRCGSILPNVALIDARSLAEERGSPPTAPRKLLCKIVPFVCAVTGESFDA